MQLDGAILAMTPFTVGEMLFGALNRKWGADKVRRLENHLKAFQMVPVDAEVGRVFGELFAMGKRAGRFKGDWNSCIDLWIAAWRYAPTCRWQRSTRVLAMYPDSGSSSRMALSYWSLERSATNAGIRASCGHVTT